MIQEIGLHKVKHGNVMSGIDDLMNGEKADIIYSDPPWGAGNLKYWQTLNLKDNGTPRNDVELDAFLAQIFSICQKYAKDVVLIEYGVRWEQEIKDMGAKYGLVHNGIAELLYRSGSKLLPLHLHIFSKSKLVLPVSYIENLKGSYGLDTLRKAIAPFAQQGKIVLDPCCGMGYTAQIAIDNGMVFRGNELNKKRLSKTIKRLENA